VVLGTNIASNLSTLNQEGKIMKKEWADKWVEALRSGKYGQGKGQLWNKHTNNYSCLGVLQELTGCPVRPFVDELDDEVKGITGITSNNGSRRYNQNDCMSLSSLNDNYDLSLEELADIIEKEWEFL
jgi:hypothetical protein